MADPYGTIPAPTPTTDDLARAKSRSRLEAADRLGYFIPPEIKEFGSKAFNFASAVDPVQGIMRGMSASGRAFDEDLPYDERRQAAIEASLETLAPLGLVGVGTLAKQPAKNILLDVLTPTGAPTSMTDDVVFDPGRRKFLQQSLAAAGTAAVAPDILSDLGTKATKVAAKSVGNIDAAVSKLIGIRKNSSSLIERGLNIESNLRRQTRTPKPSKDNKLLLSKDYADKLALEEGFEKELAASGNKPKKEVDDLYRQADSLDREADTMAYEILETIGANPQVLPKLESQTIEDLIGSFNIGERMGAAQETDAYMALVEEAIRRGMHKDYEKYPMTDIAAEYTLKDIEAGNTTGMVDLRNIDLNVSPATKKETAPSVIKEGVSPQEALELTDEDIELFRRPALEGGRGTSDSFRKALKGRNEELMSLANQLKEGKITVRQYRQAADRIRPIRELNSVPEPATFREVVSALDAGKRKKPIVGLNTALSEGDEITARLDINAYTDYDVWVPTLTHNKKTMYKPTVVMRNVEFIQPGSSEVKKALNVAAGQTKAPFAVMKGNYVDVDDFEAFSLAKENFKSDEWIQVGYDPTKRGYFYDRATGEPVLNAEEVIQVGSLVLAKNARKGNADAFAFSKGGMAMDEEMKAIFKSSRGYADGGMTESPRPKMRPELNLSYDDLKKIERVVWGEARDQGVEGRNAIRGVILNRLMSKRFPNTVDEVLSAKEFEPVRKYKGINNIPVDDETLDLQMQEMADYIQMGEDASKGSTFFLNKPVAKKRGTDFDGPNGFTINDHTFYGGYEGQEPVTDVNFSHDVRVGMAEGGLMEEDIDPISGNEVPPGSLPEEVRDDIPAQLSEGEYVVPADVVRYYGVKFFEDLRSQAKQGWSEMEANGRIGGEPITPEGMEMGGDEFPFDISELQVMDDDMPQPMNTGGIVRGFSNGGLGIDTKIDYSGALKTTPTPSNPFSPSASQGGYKIIEYTDDAGNVLYIQFLNGSPMSYIPEGFRPKGSEVQATTTTAAPVANKQVVEQDAETWKTGPRLSSAEMDRLLNTGKDYTSADLKTIAEDVKNLDKTFAPLGLLGTAIGVAQQNENRKRAYDMLDGISYQLESLNPNDKANQQIIKDLTDQKNKIQSFLNPQPKEGLMASVAKGTGIYGGKTSMYEGLSNVSGDNKVTFADTWLGDLIGADGSIGIDAKDAEGNILGLSESLAGGRRQGEDPYETSEKDMASIRERVSTSSEDTRSKSQKARDAVSTLLAAQNEVARAQSSGDPHALHEAIRAQSEASRQSTKAVQEASGWSGGFFGTASNPDWRDEE